MKGSTKTLLGFLAGIAVSAGVYAFLKSKKGKQFTKNMKDKADELKEDLADLGDKARNAMKKVEESLPQSK